MCYVFEIGLYSMTSIVDYWWKLAFWKSSKIEDDMNKNTIAHTIIYKHSRTDNLLTTSEVVGWETVFDNQRLLVKTSFFKYF